MYDQENAATLLGLIQDLAKRRNIQIPPADPNPEQQPLYEKFLRAHGFDPNDVDRVIEMNRIPEEKRSLIHGMIMHALINSEKLSDNELKGILLIVTTIFSESRATGLLRTIAGPIIQAAKQKSSA